MDNRPDAPPRELVESIFFSALDRSEADRDRFLSDSCEGDVELEAAVRSLLEAHQHTGPVDRLEGDFAAMRDRVFGPLAAGATVGPYEIVELIDAGGMGQVYRALDPRLGREVAVKVLLAAYASDPGQVKRFEHEARAAAGLSDPAILAVYDVGRHDGVPYLVSELLEGESLRRRLEVGPLAPSEATRLAVQLVKGIGVAHAAGIVHRDLKPENLFVTRDGRLKILDFGLAKLFRHPFSDAGSESNPSLTEPGRILGTVGYMSPEQARGERVDERSDLFAVGAVLSETLSGVAPFRRPSQVETLAAILNEPPSTGADLPPRLRDIVLRCLEKDPDDRYQSARDLLFALEGGAGESTGSESGARAEIAGDRDFSVAVLPFADMSPERDQQYFCEGVADEIITALTGIEGLRVAARSSSFQFRESGVDLSAIRQRLGVATVLEGSIRKAGDRLRVNVQLIDVADGYHRWSSRYDRPLEDVFAIQDEIAVSVVEALPGVLASGARAPRRQARTNVAAYELYLRGRALLTHWDQSSHVEGARRYLQEALTLDSDYAPALAALARLEAEVFRNSDPDPGHLDRADEFAQRALAADPDLAEAHVAVGKIVGSRYDYQAAAQACRRAAELAPGDPVPWDELSWALGYQVPPAAEEAEAAARKAIDIAPLMLGPHYHLGRALLAQGKLEAATRAFEHARELDANFDAPLFGLAMVHLERGDPDQALATLRENNACVNAPPVRVAFALIHAARGETDEALQLLEEVIGRGAYSDLAYLEATPHLESLRDEPRFQRLLDGLRWEQCVRTGEDSDDRRPWSAMLPYAASIAVLPFVNRSASADDEYFSDGLADELLNLLAKIRGLRVSARASSFQFKGKEASLAEVGRTLRVATILDGSVRRAGNRVRISVQLVNLADGYPLWSETYDRTIDDIFAVQDDIARSVVQELRSTLLGETADGNARDRARAEVDRAARGRSRDPEAHRLYLQARYLMDRFSREETERAIAYLEQALERDPAFALAWAELSVARLREAGFGSIPFAEGDARAREAVERSLALEPDLVEGHAQAAWIRIFVDWDWPAAQASLARALELAPSSASALRLDGVLASILGSPQKAISLFRRALEQDPLSPAVYHSLAVALLAVDSLAEAEEAFRRALDLAPRRLSTRAHLALAALGQGRTDQALAEAQREPEEGFRLWALALIHHARGEESEAEDALQGLTGAHADTYALQIAEIHAVRGELDAAFEWLERARAGRDIGLVHLKTDPRLRSLHGDSRWEGLLGRMGLRL